MTKPLVVFGAAVHAGGVPSPTLQRRCNAAIAHWRTGQFDCLVPSGGLGRHGPTEASVMAALFRDAGIDENDILQEEAATTTFETAHYVQALFADQSVERFFLVTDRYHLLRARLAFAAFGLPSASVNASGPVVGRPMHRGVGHRGARRGHWRAATPSHLPAPPGRVSIGSLAIRASTRP